MTRLSKKRRLHRAHEHQRKTAHREPTRSWHSPAYVKRHMPPLTTINVGEMVESLRDTLQNITERMGEFGSAAQACATAIKAIPLPESKPSQHIYGTCPQCKRREKVRKTTGTMGKHVGLDKKTDCPGVGEKPE